MEETLFSTDRLMQTLAQALVRDFLPSLPSDLDVADVLRRTMLLTQSAKPWREISWPSIEGCDNSYTFKCVWQLQNLMKRYRFKQDLYTDGELGQMSIQAFVANQERLTSLELHRQPPYVTALLARAGKICHGILGEYSVDDHVERCRFGSRATVGIPRRSACEAARWDLPMTGSQDETIWFAGTYLPRDPVAEDYLQRGEHSASCKTMYQVVKTLTMSLVPKTFKSLRSIVPNTTIGSLYSSGLGAMLAERLKVAGYDIKHLQKRHRMLARRASCDGSLVTADQKAASDNITTWLCRQILPPEWFKAVSHGRIDLLDLGPVIVELETFALMGNGFTFPLQTLIFLCLLKALNETYCSGRALVSVYGDDAIYSSELHPFVATVFPRLGLQLNADKTFSTGWFRESCGGDYHHGVDVRPFNPKNGSSETLDSREYEAFLYKTINGLRRRWGDDEIPTALGFLHAELAACTSAILRVPGDYPEESGVQVTSPNDLPFEGVWSPVRYNRHGTVSFDYLRRNPPLVEETKSEPYLWRQLGAHSEPKKFEKLRHNSSSPGRVARTIEDATGVATASTPTLKWKRQPLNPWCYSSPSPGVREYTKLWKCLRPTSGEDIGALERQTGSTSRWTRFTQKGLRP